MCVAPFGKESRLKKKQIKRPETSFRTLRAFDLFLFIFLFLGSVIPSNFSSNFRPIFLFQFIQLIDPTFLRLAFNFISTTIIVVVGKWMPYFNKGASGEASTARRLLGFFSRRTEFFFHSRRRLLCSGHFRNETFLDAIRNFTEFRRPFFLSIRSDGPHFIIKKEQIKISWKMITNDWRTLFYLSFQYFHFSQIRLG